MRWAEADGSVDFVGLEFGGNDERERLALGAMAVRGGSSEGVRRRLVAGSEDSPGMMIGSSWVSPRPLESDGAGAEGGRGLESALRRDLRGLETGASF